MTDSSITDSSTTDSSTTDSSTTDPSAVTFASYALDCADPAAVAHFYADLLGGSADGEPGDDWFTVTWDGPDICTQLAPNHESPDWPRGHQQAHIDFYVVDVAGAHQRVLDLGGTALDPVDAPDGVPQRGFRVYADPAGHPFCLCRPTKDAWG